VGIKRKDLICAIGAGSTGVAVVKEPTDYGTLVEGRDGRDPE
jgi:hypothetical protein